MMMKMMVIMIIIMNVRKHQEMRDLEFPCRIKITLTSLVLQYKIQKNTLTKARLVRLILI